MANTFNTPILIIAWKRPDHLSVLIESLKKITPSKVYVALDGPRENNKNDAILIAKTQKVLFDGINWPCQIKTNFQLKNLGCRFGPQAALDWFFDEEEEGIILEDDIEPCESFYFYCENLLTVFRDNERVFSINGNNLGFSSKSTDFGFTKYFNMWGWASWRRSHDKVKQVWSEFEKSNVVSTEVKRNLSIKSMWRKQSWFNYWETLFEKTKNGQIDTWDYQWIYTCLETNTACVFPHQNFTKNHGFDGSGTHTEGCHNVLGDLKYGTPWQIIERPYKTKKIIINQDYEFNQVAVTWCNYTTLKGVFLKKLIRVLPALNRYTKFYRNNNIHR